MQSIWISVNMMFLKLFGFLCHILECASENLHWNSPEFMNQLEAFSMRVKKKRSVNMWIKCPLKMIINERLHVTTRRSKKKDLIFKKPDYTFIRQCWRLCCRKWQSQRLWMSNHSTVKWFTWHEYKKQREREEKKVKSDCPLLHFLKVKLNSKSFQCNRTAATAKTFKTFWAIVS